MSYLSANLDYFRRIFDLSEAQMCGVLHLSPTSYRNYHKGQVPNSFGLSKIAKILCTEIAKRPALSRVFRRGVLPTELLDVDVEQAVSLRLTKEKTFCPDKIIGVYICYYISTDPYGKKYLRFGLLQVKPSLSAAKYKINAVFSIKTHDEAISLYNKTSTDRPIPHAELDLDDTSLFSGELSVSTTCIWASLTNLASNDYVSVGIDVCEKVFTKNRHVPFAGARGIALSRASGTTGASASFPLAVTRGPVQGDALEKLPKHLHFETNTIETRDIRSLSEHLSSLISTCYESDSAMIGNKRKLLDLMLEHELTEALTSGTATNTTFLSPEAQASFYKEIIAPIRNRLREQSPAFNQAATD